MRSAFPLLLLLAFPLIPGCHKKPLLCCEPPMAYPFNGNWRLAQIGGGFGGGIVKIPADSVILSLDPDWRYIKIVEGRIGDSGRYSIMNIPAGIGGDTTALRFSSDTGTIWAYHIHGDSLSLSPYNIYDGFDYLYLKIIPD